MHRRRFLAALAGVLALPFPRRQATAAAPPVDAAPALSNGISYSTEYSFTALPCGCVRRDTHTTSQRWQEDGTISCGESGGSEIVHYCVHHSPMFALCTAADSSNS